jgi:tetratricopeptide (TPR) repeat protein
MSRPRVIALLLALATLAVYLPTCSNGFVIGDDNDYITDNPMVQAGLTPRGVAWAFTTFHAGNWHPLTWLSLMADAGIFHLNAGGYHFVNALFHAANSALVFLLLWRLTGLIPPALLVAALFAWHPMHVESVAWLAERKDVLSTFFALLALLSYAKFAKENHRTSLWLALLFFALGLLAKPMLVTLPFVLLLLDLWPLQRLTPGTLQPLILEKIPFFALSAASCVVTYIAQQAGQAVVSLNQLPWQYRLEHLPVAAMQYLLKLLWPARLAYFYPYGPIAGGTLALALTALILISAAVWFARKKNPCWLVGWLWFLGTLVPVIGIVQVGGAAMADRYSYLPSVGLFAALAFGLYGLTWFKKFFPALAVAPLAICLVLTARQIGFWHNNETLLRHTVAVTQNNEPAHYILGVALDLDGRPDEAIAEYREMLKLNPAHSQIHGSVGIDLVKMGRPAEALEEYRQGLNGDPQNPVLHHAAGCALVALGNYRAAIEEFRQALQLNPRYAETRLELAKIYYSNGQETEGTYELMAAVRAEPDNFRCLLKVSRYLACNADAAARDPNAALLLARRADDLSAHRQPEVYDAMGMAFAAAGDFTNAALCAQKALALAPDARMKDVAPLESRLHLYQQNQPWVESFRGTNAPAVK